MKSILDLKNFPEEETIKEELILYDHIRSLMTAAEVGHIYGQDVYKLYFPIKAILILFVACGREVPEGYFEWLDSFWDDIHKTE